MVLCFLHVFLYFKFNYLNYKIINGILNTFCFFGESSLIRLFVFFLRPNLHFLIQPFNNPPIFPHPLTKCAPSLLFELPVTILFTILPVPLVDTPIWSFKDSVPSFNVLFIGPRVFSPVNPLKNSLPVHLIIESLPRVLLLVLPDVGPLTLDLVIHQVSLVRGSVDSFKLTRTIFLAHDVMPLEEGFILPSLPALSMLLIFMPLPFILGTVPQNIDPLPFCFVLLPKALVNITIWVDESSVAMGLVFLPIAYIETAIFP